MMGKIDYWINGNGQLGTQMKKKQYPTFTDHSKKKEILSVNEKQTFNWDKNIQYTDDAL